MHQFGWAVANSEAEDFIKEQFSTGKGRGKWLEARRLIVRFLVVQSLNVLRNAPYSMANGVKVETRRKRFS